MNTPNNWTLHREAGFFSRPEALSILADTGASEKLPDQLRAISASALERLIPDHVRKFIVPDCGDDTEVDRRRAIMLGVRSYQAVKSNSSAEPNATTPAKRPRGRPRDKKATGFAPTPENIRSCLSCLDEYLGGTPVDGVKRPDLFKRFLKHFGTTATEIKNLQLKQLEEFKSRVSAGQ